MQKLEEYSLPQLREIASELGLSPMRNRKDVEKAIRTELEEFEEYKREKIDKYTRLEQLGEEGKEGTTYLVKNEKGKKLAMKTFRKTKSSKTLEKEYNLQLKAGKAGVAPKVYDLDTVDKWIVMERMDTHLLRSLEETKSLSQEDQERILSIYKKLDKIGIYHNDANLMNYMVRKGKIYLIDYGFAKEITPALAKKLGTNEPNYKLMLIGFLIKLKELSLSSSSTKYLLKHVEKEDREKYGL